MRTIYVRLPYPGSEEDIKDLEIMYFETYGEEMRVELRLHEEHREVYVTEIEESEEMDFVANMDDMTMLKCGRVIPEWDGEKWNDGY